MSWLLSHITKFLTASIIVLVSCDRYNPTVKAIEYDAQYEQSLRGFILVTKTSKLDTSLKRLDSILIEAEIDSSVFRKTASIFESSFGNLNSSFRNDELYAHLLSRRLLSHWYSAEEKQVAANRIKLIQQNKQGSPANDFMYLTPAGYRKWVYDISSEFVLLFFYSPECPACKDMKQALSQSAIISKKLSEKRLKILAVYIDKEEEVWLNHLNEMPDVWMNGRDDNEYLYTNNIYDLRAIPSVYLLDRNKRVILKDCLNLSTIEEQLE